MIFFIYVLNFIYSRCSKILKDKVDQANDVSKALSKILSAKINEMQVFNYSQKDAHDWESLGLGDKETVEEVEPEAYTPFIRRTTARKRKSIPTL